jgi:cytidylate kinase
MIITIDGPAAAGKSTLAKGLSKSLNWIYLDSGATYRAAALCAIENGIDLNDAEACAGLIRNASIDLDFSPDGETIVILNGRNISVEIRTDKVSEAASRISVHPEVRSELVALQRKIAEGKDIIAEGRDMGSIVFPHADLKIYLDAPIDERALRRKDELKKEGASLPISEIIESIDKRDKRDMARKASPLTQTPDSVYLNNGNLRKEETLKLALKIIHDLLHLDIPRD